MRSIVDVVVAGGFLLGCESLLALASESTFFTFGVGVSFLALGVFEAIVVTVVVAVVSVAEVPCFFRSSLFFLLVAFVPTVSTEIGFAAIVWAIVGSVASLFSVGRASILPLIEPWVVLFLAWFGVFDVQHLVAHLFAV